MSLTLAVGTYLGKSGVRQYCEGHANPGNEFMHEVMQLSGIIDVSPDGETAKGQWYGFGAIAIPVEKGVVQRFFGGIYGVDYVKEDGRWKFEKLRFDQGVQLYTASGLGKAGTCRRTSHDQTAIALKADIRAPIAHVTLPDTSFLSISNTPSPGRQRAKERTTRPLMSRKK